MSSFYNLKNLIISRVAVPADEIAIQIFDGGFTTLKPVEKIEKVNFTQDRRTVETVRVGVLFSILQRSGGLYQLFSYGVAFSHTRIFTVTNLIYVPKVGLSLFSTNWIRLQIEASAESWFHDSFALGLAFGHYDLTALWPYTDEGLNRAQSQLLEALQQVQDAGLSLANIAVVNGNIPRGLIGDQGQLNAGSLYTLAVNVSKLQQQLDRQVIGHHATMLYPLSNQGVKKK